MNSEENRRDWVLQSRRAVTLVADKWRLTVLHALAPGPLRHGELQRALDGISAKMLTQTLRGLERDGLVHRQMYMVVPPRVDYSLTSLGQSFLDPLRKLCHWATRHAEELDAARERYDDRANREREPRPVDAPRV